MYVVTVVLIITFNVIILIYYFTIYSYHEPWLIQFPIYIFLHFVKDFHNLSDTPKFL